MDKYATDPDVYARFLLFVKTEVGKKLSEKTTREQIEDLEREYSTRSEKDRRKEIAKLAPVALATRRGLMQAKHNERAPLQEQYTELMLRLFVLVEQLNPESTYGKLTEEIVAYVQEKLSNS